MLFSLGAILLYSTLPVATILWCYRYISEFISRFHRFVIVVNILGPKRNDSAMCALYTKRESAVMSQQPVASRAKFNIHYDSMWTEQNTWHCITACITVTCRFCSVHIAWRSDETPTSTSPSCAHSSLRGAFQYTSFTSVRTWQYVGMNLDETV